MKQLQIFINSNCENEHENIEEFLLSNGSTKIEGIWLFGYSIKIQNEYYNSEDEYYFCYEVLSCSCFFNGLRNAMSKSTKYIWIDRILFSSKEFSAILRAAKHAKKLCFNECKILTDGEYELGEMQGWQIEYLRVYYHNNVYKHPRDYEDNYMKIFLSIVGCHNLLRSLKRIIFNWGKEMKEKLLSKAKEILGNDYDMLMPRFKCLKAI